MCDGIYHQIENPSAEDFPGSPCAFYSSMAETKTSVDEKTHVLTTYEQRIRDELFGVLAFWQKHSPDPKRGGFFSCLDVDGEVYDHRKFMWLNGRQIYMYATVAATYTEEEIDRFSGGTVQRKTLLADAHKAAAFMYDHGVRDTDGKVYFSLAQDGKPYHMERKIFSACFLCLGLGCLAAVLRHDGATETKEIELLLKRCYGLLESIVNWSHDPSPLGREACPGAPVTSPMNVPMILLNLLDEFRKAGILPLVSSSSPSPSYPSSSTSSLATCQVDVEKEEAWCIQEILKHVRPDERRVLEVVLVDGSTCPGYDGRHMNPGHAIEAGWFVLNYAQRTRDEKLAALAQDMIVWSFKAGWDTEHGGGILYFLDSEGRSPPYLEWDMKLWWPHCEAMVAFAKMYQHTKDEEHLHNFIKVTDYALDHFSDSKGTGEWFGYLNRQGIVTHRFKGGPYKGCFHVPRALLLVHQSLLTSLSECKSK